jgi:hypothetical protein
VSVRALAIVIVVAGCTSGDKPARKRDAGAAVALADAIAIPDAPIDSAPVDPNWATRFDFDGDGAVDPITNTFSGGAHCCYKVAVALSKTGRAIALPFELDGGYVRGLDLSQPASFDVERDSDGVAALRMRIATYAGRAQPIPQQWVRTYGIHSHSIRVVLRDGAPRVENVMGSCAHALDQLAKVEVTGWDGLPRCDEAELVDFLDAARSGLERTFGTERRIASTKHRIVDLDAGRELVLVFDRDLVRVDLDHVAPASAIVEAFGPPDARLPYTMWGTTHRTGQWVWPGRGLVVYVDPSGTTVHHLGVFTPTDLATYRRSLAWPVQ